MGGSNSDIIKKLKELTAAPMIVFPAVVLSVDEELFVATVKPDDQAELDVRLKSAEDDSEEYFIQIPRVNSIVLVALIQNDEAEAVLLKANEIDKFIVKLSTKEFEINSSHILMKCDDKSLEMTDTETLFNGGANGGLIKIEQLKTEYNKTKESVDAMMNVLNGGSVPEPGMGAPSALQSALSGALAGKSTGSFDSITNDTVKH